MRSANVQPQRADQILGLMPVIEKIESAIRDAAICVADVSVDNPNVWLEVGYALALNRPCVILCDRSKRERLPFDIQHRPVILYRTDSKSGYEELEKNLVRLVENELKKERSIQTAPVLKTGIRLEGGLRDYEVALLSTLLALWPSSPIGALHWDLEKKLKTMRFKDVALGLGIANLLEIGYIQQTLTEEVDHGEFYQVKRYQITPQGISWLREHEDQLDIRQDIPF